MVSRKKTVFVGMSGGVDSSVSAALLERAGYDVVGVFIKVWSPPWLPCHWPEERRDAMRAAAHLDIPFLTLDLEKEYKRAVVDYMVREYRAGRTPNPDVMCNKEIKFGAFLEWARERGAGYVATGHYARVGESEHGKYELRAGADAGKDQSYFLWTLGQEQLRSILFPVGDLKKSEVRALARTFALPVAEKKDSQGLCFVGHVDMKQFLHEFFTTKPGDVFDGQGNMVGRHEGAELYTIGQRHGFDILKKTARDTPLYVVGKDVAANTITVAPRPEPYFSSAGSKIALRDVSWVSGAPPDISKKYSARIRYRAPLVGCRIQSAGADSASVVLDQPDGTIAPGQSLVFYDEDLLIGGGIIC